MTIICLYLHCVNFGNMCYINNIKNLFAAALHYLFSVWLFLFVVFLQLLPLLRRKTGNLEQRSLAGNKLLQLLCFLSTRAINI